MGNSEFCDIHMKHIINHCPYMYRLFDFISLRLLVNKTFVNMEAPACQWMDGTTSSANAHPVCREKLVI